MDLGQQMICQYWRNLLYSTYISNDNQSYQCIVLERTQEVGFGKQLVVFPQFQLEKIGFFFVICLFLTWCGVGFISKILGDIDMIYVLDNLIKVQQQFIYDDKPWLINLSIVCMLFFPPYPFSFQMNIYQIVNRIFDQGNFISVCIWQQVSPFPNVLFFYSVGKPCFTLLLFVFQCQISYSDLEKRRDRRGINYYFYYYYYCWYLDNWSRVTCLSVWVYYIEMRNMYSVCWTRFF
eukprot:TRINITY_DN4541_c2_g1_i3.p3 TRINITY_DN4541_c2_g1~~TRINITY_DN4541_c2_g1_i3.p3  ORF type:complete len:235 (+),score=-2.35 TRINITY_DN4541_c2_g1_i3:395-1099(+)